MQLVRVLILDENPLRAMDFEYALTQAGAEAILCRTVGQAELVGRFEAAFVARRVRDGCCSNFAAQLYQRNIPFTVVTAAGRETLTPALSRGYFLACPYNEEELHLALAWMLRKG